MLDENTAAMRALRAYEKEAQEQFATAGGGARRISSRLMFQTSDAL
jgi:hypothetical protein